MDWRLVPLEHVCSINPKDRDSHELPDDTLVSFVPMRAVSETTCVEVTPSYFRARMASVP